MEDMSDTYVCLTRLSWRVQVVLANVNQDTFGAYLDVASSHRLQRLEAKCIDFLLANFDKVARSSHSTCTYAGVACLLSKATQVRMSYRISYLAAAFGKTGAGA